MVVPLHDLSGPDPDLDVDQGPLVGLPTAADDQGLGRVDVDVLDPERDVVAPDPEIVIVDPSRGRAAARDQNPGKSTGDQGPNLVIGTGKVGRKMRNLARLKR